MSSTIIEKSFKTNLWVMKLFHLYPPDNYSLAFKVRAWLLYLVLIFPVPVLSILNLIFENNFAIDRLQYNLAFVVQTIGYIIMYSPFIFNAEKFKECISFCDSPFLNNLKSNQKLIINEWIKSCKFNTSAYLTCCIAVMTAWSARPLSWNGRHFPVDIWLPFRTDKNTGLFYCIYLFIVAEMYCPTISLAVIDPLVSGLAYLAAGHIRILKDNLEHLYEYSVENNKLADSSTIYNNIKNCVMHYNEVLKFIKSFQSFFAPVVVSHVMSSVLVICFSILQLNRTEFLSFNFCQAISSFTLILSEVYFYCYYGTILFEESNSISVAVAKSQWYKYDIKSKKALVIFMERTKRPIVVTCGKYIKLSLETFFFILRRSYSLVAVFQNIDF